MSFGESVRAKRTSEGILNYFVERVGLSAAYGRVWSEVKSILPAMFTMEKPPPSWVCVWTTYSLKAGRLPPDMRQDIEGVMRVYRSRRQPRTIAHGVPISNLIVLMTGRQYN